MVCRHQRRVIGETRRSAYPCVRPAVRPVRRYRHEPMSVQNLKNFHLQYLVHDASRVPEPAVALPEASAVVEADQGFDERIASLVWAIR
jgi:hypothetical protein